MLDIINLNFDAKNWQKRCIKIHIMNNLYKIKKNVFKKIDKK